MVPAPRTIRSSGSHLSTGALSTSESAKMKGVVLLFGLLNVLSGIAGVAVGSSSAPAGWWLIVVGLIFATLGWRRLRDVR